MTTDERIEPRRTSTAVYDAVLRRVVEQQMRDWKPCDCIECVCQAATWWFSAYGE